MESSRPGFLVQRQLPELAQCHIHWVGHAVPPSHLLSSPSPPAFNPSQHQGLFQWVGSSHQVAKVLELQLQHQSFSEYSELISFRTDWFDLLAFQRTLFWTPQFKSISSSALSFLFGPTLTSIRDYRKNHRFDYIDLVSKVMSLLFNMLSRLVIAFLPRSKCLLISCLQSPFTVILSPRK